MSETQLMTLDEMNASENATPAAVGKYMTLDEMQTDPVADKVPFIKSLGLNIYAGVLEAGTQFNKLIGLGVLEQTKELFIDPGQKEIDHIRETTRNGSSPEKFAQDFAFSLGSMGLTLPLDIMSGGATKAAMAEKILPETFSIISKIPNFAIGMGERAFLKSVEEGKPVEGVVKGAEATSLGILYGSVGTGWSSFPKMASLGLAEAHYEAIKEGRIATPEEQVTGVANGLAFATVFHTIGAIEKGVNTIADKFYLSKLKDNFETAMANGNIDDIKTEYQKLIDNPEIDPKVKEVLTTTFEKVRSEYLSDKNVSSENSGKQDSIQTMQKPTPSPIPSEKQEIPGSVASEPPIKESLPQEDDPVKKVISALKEAESLRGKQETLYSQERAKRLAKIQAVRQGAKGEKGFYSELGALKGELPKVEFESIRSKIGQEDIDTIFNMVADSPKLTEWDKISTREGLAKLFGEFGGRVPTEREITLLNRVFGKEFTEAMIAKRNFWQKVNYAGLQIANIPRSLMASFDLSAPFRQGVFLIGRPKEFWPAFSKMFNAFGSEKFYQELQNEIVRHPNFEIARESKLSLTDMDSLLNEREERFMSNWVEQIPGIGKGVRASGRAYTGFLNKLRFDVFNDLVDKAEKLGLNPKGNRDLTVSIADFVNNATGRGTLPGGMKNSLTSLNAIFFSPRLMASRFNLIMRPDYYWRLDPFVRKEALKSLGSFIGTGFTILTLAALAGAEVGTDPRSADFGKIKIGNTRFDIWGGFQQWVKLTAQIATGKIVSSTSGRIMTLGEGYKPTTRWDILLRFFESKQAPVASFFVDAMKGKTMIGEKFDMPKEVAQRFIPMVLSDMWDVLNDNPSLFPAGLLGAFGVGVQTYRRKRIRR